MDPFNEKVLKSLDEIKYTLEKQQKEINDLKLKKEEELKEKTKIEDKAVTKSNLVSASSGINVTALDNVNGSVISPNNSLNNSLINYYRIPKFNRLDTSASTFLASYEHMQQMRGIDLNSDRMALELVEFLNIYESIWYDTYIQPIIGKKILDRY